MLLLIMSFVDPGKLLQQTLEGPLSPLLSGRRSVTCALLSAPLFLPEQRTAS